MNKTHRTPDELVQIYTFSQQGLNTTQIAERLGISYDSVVGALLNLKRYLSGKAKDQSRLSKNYKTAVKLIRRQRRLNTPPTTTEPATGRTESSEGDNFASLKESFAQFQQAISTFIEAEINSRFDKLVAENKRLREENERLKKEKEDSRTINWVDALEYKLTKEEEK